MINWNAIIGLVISCCLRTCSMYALSSKSYLLLNQWMQRQISHGFDAIQPLSSLTLIPHWFHTALYWKENGYYLTLKFIPTPDGFAVEDKGWLIIELRIYTKIEISPPPSLTLKLMGPTLLLSYNSPEPLLNGTTRLISTFSKFLGKNVFLAEIVLFIDAWQNWF